MCGIAGFNWEDKALIKRMTDVISYRGPDDSGHYVDRNISLGHRRLSIVDLSAKGHQPMQNEEGTITIVFNGEIYNFKELKPKLSKHDFKSDSDTEVLIHGYEEWGLDGLLQRINGMFAFAIYDAQKKALYLARDRLGKKPLYYYVEQEKIIFASELKSLLQWQSLPRTLDEGAVNSFLKYRFIPTDATMMKGVKKLLPAHYAVHENGALRIRRYWDLDWREEAWSDDESIKRFKSLFEKCVEDRLFADVPLGAFLSGGLDSSAVVAANARLRDDPVKTFSVGFNHETDEVAYARQVAEHLGCEHHELILDYKDMTKRLGEIVWHMDEPSSDITMVPMYFLSQFSRKHVTVVSSGEGADELLGGYPHYKVGSASFSAVPGIVKRSIYNWYYSPFKKADRDAFFVQPQTDDTLLKRHLDAKRPAELLNKLLDFDIKHELPNWQLPRLDRMSMAHSQEARCPFMDFRLAELAARLPVRMKMKDITGKYILRQATKDVLPKIVLTRKKQGFTTPMHEWLKQDLLGLADQVLSKERMARRSHVNYGYIEKLLTKQRSQRRTMPFNYTSFKLLSILLLEMWQTMYLDNGAKRMSAAAIASDANG
jgi:asparagine synthase (glutamine-hydrolysing)